MSTLFDRPFVAAHTGLVGSPIDRDDRIRRDEQALAAQRMHPGARWMVLDNLEPLVDTSNSVDIQWLRRSEIDAPDAIEVFLGLDHDMPRFAVAGSAVGLPGEVIDPRRAAASMDDGRAAIVAHARSLIDWHQRHGYCANCGGLTELKKAGYARRCGTCGAEHFPRTDPVVIMLAVHDGSVLMGRQPRFPQGFLSALAGFVEPGESLEEAVRRELYEEAGIRTGRVTYVASQPWPFPSSLMVGAFAEALTTEITMDEEELAEVRWVSRDDVIAAFEGTGSFLVPPALAIAHTLLKTWVNATV